MMRPHWMLELLCFLSFLSPAWAQQGDDLDVYGGIKSISFKPTGFFYVAQDQAKRWWFVTPEGHGYYGVGVCCVRSEGDPERYTGRKIYQDNLIKTYGSIEKWAQVTESRLKQWGFNLRGEWSTDEVKILPHTVILDIGGANWLTGEMPDFFDPTYYDQVHKRAEEVCTSHRNDPALVGYFLDNEMQWAPDWRFGPSLFNRYMALPADAPGKQAITAYFQDRYKAVEKYNEVWEPSITAWAELSQITRLAERAGKSQQALADREVFVRKAAERYFELTTRAVRSVDPNHLVLGCRFTPATVPQVVVEACGKYCDVVSINYYANGILAGILLNLIPADISRVRQSDDMRYFHAAAGKPLMITEFSFRSADSGLPNSHPNPFLVQPWVHNQKERAARYEKITSQWARAPYMIGYTWFQYQDEPRTGRYDGECGNYGLVTIEDVPYTDFVKRVQACNIAAVQHHLEGSK